MFFKVLPLPIWQHLAEYTNSEILQKKLANKYSIETAHRYCEPVIVKELLYIIGLMQVFQGRKNNSTLEAEFKDDPPFKYSKWSICQKQYNVIINSLTCDWTIFFALIQEAWQAAFKPGEFVVVDKAL